MRTLWAVLRREIWERRQVVWLGLFLGVLCPVVAYLPFGFRASQDAMRDGLVLGVTMGFFALMSLLVGMGLFASDQTAGRVGFYLARPVRPWQLLVGRVVAAALVLLLGTLLVSLPTLALTGRVSSELGVDSTLMALVLVMLALAASHAAAVTLRLRGRWTLFDLGALAATGLLVGSTLQQAAQNRLVGVPEVLTLLLSGVVISAALAGLWFQLRTGGVQRGRLHAAFSIPFWSVVLLVAVSYDARLRLALAKDWDDVQSFSAAIPSSDGSSVWLKTSEGLPRPLSYVLDLERQRRIPVDTAQWLSTEPLLQGRSVIWLRCDRERLGKRRFRVKACGPVKLDLDADSPNPVRLSIPDFTWKGFDYLLLSPDGRDLWVATDQADQARRFALPEARLAQTVEVQGLRGLVGFSLDGRPLVRQRTTEESLLVAVSADGTLEPVFPPTAPARGLQALSRDGLRWQVDADVPPSCFYHAPPDAWLESCGWRRVDSWRVWIRSDQKLLYARTADGREIEPVSIPTAQLDQPKDSGETESDYLRLGPEAETGRLMVLSARFRWPSDELTGLALRPTDLPMQFWTFARHRMPWREESWTTSYVDLAAGQVLASFHGFRVVQKQIETPSGPEVWLLDERGMPHRFDPAQLDPNDPIASLEPVFRPPWSDGT